VQKTKEKRSSHNLARRLPFVIVWALSGMMVGTVANIFMATELARNLTIQQAVMTGVLWSSIVGGLVYIVLIERLLKHSMRGWLVYSLIGSAITLFFSNILTSRPIAEPDIFLVLMAIVHLVPPLLLQTLWLRQRVQKAGLWMMTVLMTATVSNIFYTALPELGRSPISPPALVLGLIFGLITGSVMHYLWSHPKADEKAKVDFATDEDSNRNYERLARLQERDRSNPLWEISDDQALQSEA
jgi:drug/metabolite transporter (DMT)-like permease